MIYVGLYFWSSNNQCYLGLSVVVFHFFICCQCWLHVEGWKMVQTSLFTSPPPLSLQEVPSLYLSSDWSSPLPGFSLTSSLLSKSSPLLLPLPFSSYLFISAYFHHCLPSLPFFLPLCHSPPPHPAPPTTFSQACFETTSQSILAILFLSQCWGPQVKCLCWSC